MGLVFSLCNQKGGVGKTTTAINIATGVGQKGFRALIIDSDPQSNATSGLGQDINNQFKTIYDFIVDDYPISETIRPCQFQNVSLIASNPDLGGAEIELTSVFGREFRLKKGLDSIKDQFDYIFIDCPPSLGLLTINALTASDYILIPLQCEYYALEGLSQLIRTHALVSENLNPNLQIGGILLTMADFRTNLTQQVINEVRKHFKEKVFETVIARSVSLGEAPSFGKPGILYDPNSRGAKNYKLATDEFLKKFPQKKESPGQVSPVAQEEIKT